MLLWWNAVKRRDKFSLGLEESGSAGSKMSLKGAEKAVEGRATVANRLQQRLVI